MNSEEAAKRLREGEPLSEELLDHLSKAFDAKFGELSTIWNKRFRNPASVLIKSTLYRKDQPPVGVDLHLVFRRPVHKGAFQFLIRTEEERLEDGSIVTRSFEEDIEDAEIDVKADAATCLHELEHQLERAEGVDEKDLLFSLTTLDQFISRHESKNGS